MEVVRMMALLPLWPKIHKYPEPRVRCGGTNTI